MDKCVGNYWAFTKENRFHLGLFVVKNGMGHFSDQLEALKGRGRYRSLQLPMGVDLTSNDYLGLAAHPVLRARAVELLEGGIGIGAAGSRLLRGQAGAHKSLEIAAAAFFDAPASLYFPSGFQANLALFGTLCSRHDTVIYDELLHASARDGIASCSAKSVRVRHNDLDGFEAALKAAAESRRVGGQIWVAVESLYSMDGDLAPLAALHVLCGRYDAMLIIDEAHSSGVMGAGGGGFAAGFGYERVIALHTCGKALGVAGGLICGSEEVIAYLINKARPFIYSTAPMPLQAALVEESLRIVKGAEGDARRESLVKLCRIAQDLFGGSGTHVVPIMIGGDERAVEVAEAAQAAGYDIRAIRPPTVAEGTARLRLSLGADLKESELRGFAAMIQPLLDRESA